MITQRRKGAEIENPHPSASFENHRIHQNQGFSRDEVGDGGGRISGDFWN